MTVDARLLWTIGLGRSTKYLHHIPEQLGLGGQLGDDTPLAGRGVRGRSGRSVRPAESLWGPYLCPPFGSDRERRPSMVRRAEYGAM